MNMYMSRQDDIYRYSWGGDSCVGWCDDGVQFVCDWMMVEIGFVVFGLGWCWV